MANLATLSFNAPFLSGPMLKESPYALITDVGQTTVTINTIFDLVYQVRISSSDDSLKTSMWSASGGIVPITGLVQQKHYKITVMGI